MSFGVLALIVLAGLAGPLLAFGRSGAVPVVIGELLAGVIVGKTGFGAIDPTNVTVSFFGDVGFAMLMFAAGMAVPLRDRRVLASLRTGGIAAGIVALLSPLAGLAAAASADTGHAAVFAVVIASGSAAFVLPMLEQAKLSGPEALAVMAQVTIADVATIVAVPIVLQPSRVGQAALGANLVAAAVIAILIGARALRGRDWVDRLRKRSRQRQWALDLRLALLILFFLAWIAQKSGTSVLIAGFGAGLMVAALGGPRRLSRQVLGIAQGFFIPLFFVVLGARLDLRALLDHPSVLALAAALIVLNVVIHTVAAIAVRRPASTGLIACAQLGVPAAVVSLGLQEAVISPAQGAAIIVAALFTLPISAFGVELLARRDRRPRAQSTRTLRAAK